MELINKWGVVSKLIDLENEFQHYKPFQGFEHAMYRKICELEIAIGKTSGVDLVQCKDCKYFYLDDEYGRTWCCYNKCGTTEVAENGYCYRGERKDNA